MATQEAQLPALSDEEKELVEKMSKELESLRNVATSDEKQVVNLMIGNTAWRTLLLKEIHPFSGHWQDSGPPQTIYRKQFGDCVHELHPTGGSKVAVAYVADGHRWIFAWNIPFQAPISLAVLRNKVYCEFGEDTDGPINWTEIEQKLDATTPIEKPIRTSHFFINMLDYGSSPALMIVCTEPVK